MLRECQGACPCFGKVALQEDKEAIQPYTDASGRMRASALDLPLKFPCPAGTRVRVAAAGRSLGAGRNADGPSLGISTAVLQPSLARDSLPSGH